jgi:lipopolysaccharide transport system permease protein
MAVSLPLRGIYTHRELIGSLVGRDVKIRYKQSLLGYAWAILYPLATALVYSVVGGLIMRAQSAQLPYPVFSYFGLLFWSLFSTGLSAATESLVSNLSLITKVYFPREVFPIATVLSKLVDFGFGLIGMVPLLLYYRVAPDWLHLPLILLPAAVLLLYTTGMGMLAACLNLFYRDARHIVGIALSLGVFLIPNIYPLGLVPRAWQPLYLLNPVATLTEAARRLAFPQTGWLRAVDPAQGNLQSFWPYLAWATVVSVGLFAAGFVVFKRQEPRFAEFV